MFINFFCRNIFQILDFFFFFFFLCKIATPSEKSYPPLFQQPPSQSLGPVKPSLFENLVGGSTPSPTPETTRGGGRAHYALCLKLCLEQACSFET